MHLLNIEASHIFNIHLNRFVFYGIISIFQHVGWRKPYISYTEILFHPSMCPTMTVIQTNNSELTLTVQSEAFDSTKSKSGTGSHLAVTYAVFCPTGLLLFFCRITQTSSGSLLAQSCGWATSMKEERYLHLSTSYPVQSPCGTCLCGCTHACADTESPDTRTSVNVETSKSSRYDVDRMTIFTKSQIVQSLYFKSNTVLMVVARQPRSIHTNSPDMFPSVELLSSV